MGPSAGRRVSGLWSLFHFLLWLLHAPTEQEEMAAATRMTVTVQGSECAGSGGRTWKTNANSFQVMLLISLTWAFQLIRASAHSVRSWCAVAQPSPLGGPISPISTSGMCTRPRCLPSLSPRRGHAGAHMRTPGQARAPGLFQELVSPLASQRHAFVSASCSQGKW